MYGRLSVVIQNLSLMNSM